MNFADIHCFRYNILDFCTWIHFRLKSRMKLREYFLTHIHTLQTTTSTRTHSVRIGLSQSIFMCWKMLSQFPTPYHKQHTTLMPSTINSKSMSECVIHNIAILFCILHIVIVLWGILICDINSTDNNNQILITIIWSILTLIIHNLIEIESNGKPLFVFYILSTSAFGGFSGSFSRGYSGCYRWELFLLIYIVGCCLLLLNESHDS